jgi:hypothetical protein
MIMHKKFVCSITLAVIFAGAGSLQAKPFSLGAVQDIELGNDTQVGPGASSNGTGLGARDISTRRRVVLISYDISALKKEGRFSNVSFSHFSHDLHGQTNVYGIVENLDLLEVESLTWNTAPGVQNNPTPPLDAPVQLDLADLTDVLLTFAGPGQTGVRFSTDASEALANSLNSDNDGIITFLFAPGAQNSQLIVRSTEHTAGGSFLQGEVSPSLGVALHPNPLDGAADVVADVTLSWTAGQFANKHNVYLGTSFNDVNSAGFGSPQLVGPAHDANSYDAGRLEFDQTYYWRVDEVDAPPSNAVHRGVIWSFTVEPFAIPIDSIVATASSQVPDQGPENTVNGSGLADQRHSTRLSDMWLTSESNAGPVWIQFDFEKPYKLHEMLVWNYNREGLNTIYGLRAVIIEHSTDGTSWTLLSDVPEFPKAPGTDDCTPSTVNLQNVIARYVKITANSNWSGGLFNQYGLSEIRFMAIPVSARKPIPDAGATDVAVDVTLGWRAGREAAEHNVYLSTDEQAVINGTADVVTVTDAGHNPLSLDLGSTYYWRVDEVNNVETPSTWKGNLWSFTTRDYLIVEDFESYNDIDPPNPGSNRVFDKWVDGFGTTTNGAVAGNTLPPYTERGNVHGGGQAMPLSYDNNFKFSEATLTLKAGNDWTRQGVANLSLWFRAVATNAAEKMYVVLNGTAVVYNTDPAPVQTAAWTEWVIPLQQFAALGVDLTNVTSITIGFGTRGNTALPGGTGQMYFDDIRLVRPATP